MIETERLAAANIGTLGPLPDGWRWVRLGDHVLKLGSGITPLGGYTSYLSSGTPFIRSQNVHMNQFSLKGLAHISSEQNDVMQSTVVHPGDVLLNITGASIGRVCVVPPEICPANVNQHVSIIRVDQTIAPEYLAFYLSNPEFQTHIMESQAGATRQALTKAIIEDFEVPLPPLPEQQRIAAILRDQMAAVEQARVAAEAQIEAARARPAAYLQAVFESEDAHGWPRVPLGQLVTFQNGRAFPSSEYALTGVRLLRPGNLYADGTVQWNASNTRLMPELWATGNPDLIVRGGELVMSLTAQSLKDEFLGRVCMTDQNNMCLLNQRLARITPSTSLNARYTLYALKSPAFRKYVDGLNSGSLIQHMFTSQLTSYCVPLPEEQRQRTIAETLDSVFTAAEALRCAIQARLDTINKLPATLLRRAFSRDQLEAEVPETEEG